MTDVNSFNRVTVESEDADSTTRRLDGSASSNPDPASQPLPGLQWQPPAGWKREPPTQMVLAKFSVSAEAGARAEITVSAFPGEVGGLLANVNRWRSQVGLPPIGETELGGIVTGLETRSGSAKLVELAGADARTGNKARLLSVVLPHGDRTWFFKMIGEDQLVEREKEAFLKFVRETQLPDAP